jgi:hypothetical protein
MVTHYVDGKPASDVDDELFAYCVANGMLRISSNYDHQNPNSKVYGLTEIRRDAVSRTNSTVKVDVTGISVVC